MVELRPARSRADLRTEPVLRSSASETASTRARREKEVGFSGIRIGRKPGTGGRRFHFSAGCRVPHFSRSLREVGLLTYSSRQAQARAHVHPLTAVEIGGALGEGWRV